MEIQNFQDYLDKCEAAFDETMAPVKEKLRTDDLFASESAKKTMERMVDDLVREFVGDFHKSMKLCLQDVLTSQCEDSSSGEEEEVDFEEEPMKKTEEIKCPKCKRPINASRFAPHLEKCMKMGRSSSRIARTRIAKNTSDTFHGAVVSDDDEADEDWNLEKATNVSKRPQEPKKKKGKQSQSRRNKLPKLAREDIFEQKDKTPYTKFMVMTVEEKINFLSGNCGVRIEGSGNICTKSLRCTQHAEEDRVAVRKSSSLEPPLTQESFVDIEGVVEQRSEPDRSCTPSPAGTPTPTPPNSASKRKKSKQKSKDWGQES